MSSMGLRLLSAEFQLVWICRSKIIPHSPATAWAEGAQLNGRPFPATASAEGAQFNVPPSSPARVAIATAAVCIGYKGWCIASVAPSCQTKRSAGPFHRVSLLPIERAAHAFTLRQVEGGLRLVLNLCKRDGRRLSRLTARDGRRLPVGWRGQCAGGQN